MPTFLAAYDLKETNPDPHETFLEKAIERGWSPWKKADDGYWYRLPNTTLEGSFDDRDAAVAALKAARKDTEEDLEIKVRMEKWIVVTSSAATWNSDVKEKE